ncbi:polyprenyl synthetase family protein [Lentibacillus sp. CBA3610]|uniref:polyprenyl synthetase family protein n=1 Tax=Lentibacillus sp. CBA3610 TaxID=2518176 RepID=UPI0015956C9F|nr:farnesyl diphosphate synthase [Lentibacillus sp. CBA3610]QKY69292.1 polyprenyl synthetase family protein [Lentibacillus sp. CBA3610]
MIVNQELNDLIATNREIIQRELQEHLDKLEIPERLKASMVYSIEAGGKRLRPALLIASFYAYNHNINKVLSSAAALEMIHTYSLIHDDLPAMDDDDIRRGLPTNHKKFDEATAILAGDALLTFSFDLITNDPLLTDRQKVQLVQLLSEGSGPKGMIAGQFLDMEAEKKAVTLEELENIHTLKTGELFRFAIRSGAFLGEATDEQIRHLDEYAHFLGLIFQVQDDILDVTGDPDKIGKPVGSDEDNEKNTYVRLLGLNGAIDKKNHYVQRAKQALNKADAEASHLMSLIDYFSKRDH